MKKEQIDYSTPQPLTMQEAITEAKRCLHCKVPMCRKGCPIGNDIPSFIHQLSKGNLGDAMAIINETASAHTRSNARVTACSTRKATP